MASDKCPSCGAEINQHSPGGRWERAVNGVLRHPMLTGMAAALLLGAVAVGGWLMAGKTAQAQAEAEARLAEKTHQLQAQLENAFKHAAPIQPPTSETLRLRAEVARLRQQTTESEGELKGLREELKRSKLLAAEAQLRSARLENRLSVLGATTNSTPEPPRVGAWLGVNIRNSARSEVTAGQPTAPAGVEVVGMSPSSPAYHSGVQVGDVIVGLDGQQILGTDQFKSLMEQRRPNEAVALDVLRSGAPLRIEVTPTDWPK